jgi:hypothetical protein
MYWTKIFLYCEEVVAMTAHHWLYSEQIVYVTPVRHCSTACITKDNLFHYKEKKKGLTSY